ncbi:hypothetical protein PG988_012842 [Apiospora saccharicola]
MDDLSSADSLTEARSPETTMEGDHGTQASLLVSDIGITPVCQYESARRLLEIDRASAGAGELRYDQEAPRISMDRDEDGQEEAKRLLATPDSEMPEYANKQRLSKFIPELDPDHKRAKTFRVRRSKRTTMIVTQSLIAVVVMAVNTGILIWLPRVWPLESRGIGTIKYGNCMDIRILNATLHVGLNIASSLLLGAGNYCMQILAAPSRLEICQAHAKGASLDIGVPSMRNFLYIKPGRLFLWLSIMLCSTVLHLMSVPDFLFEDRYANCHDPSSWNSAIFISLPVAAVPRAVATNDFRSAADNWTTSDPLGHYDWWQKSHYGWWETKSPALFREELGNRSAIYALQSELPDMIRLGPQECAQRNIDPLKATGSVIVVARDTASTQNNGSSLIDGWVSGWQAWADSHTWVCNAQYRGNWYCDADFAATFGDNWKVLAGPNTVSVDHCLVGPEADNDERCGLHYNAYIMGIVCVFTFLMVVLIWVVLFQHVNTKKPDHGRSKVTLVTVGDAISNFLAWPEDTEDTVRKPKSTKSRRKFAELVKSEWEVMPHISWFKAVSNWTWAVSLCFFALGFAITIYMLNNGIKILRHAGVDMGPSGIWKHPMRVNPIAVDSGTGSDRSLRYFMGCIFKANWLQLMISFLYLFYNNILTRQLVTDEFLRYLRDDGKKPLRVSSPVGMQRSTYFLSLPWKYSGPLMLTMIVFHTLISQSLFLIQTSAFGPGRDGTRLPDLDFTATAFSIPAAVAAISLGFLLVLGIILHSVLRHWSDIPRDFHRLSYNSSALNVLCQRPLEDGDAHLFPVRLGVVGQKNPSDENQTPRIIFSTNTTLGKLPPAGLSCWGPGSEQTNPVKSHRLKWSEFIRSSRSRDA